GVCRDGRRGEWGRQAPNPGGVGLGPPGRRGEQVEDEGGGSGHGAAYSPVRRRIRPPRPAVAALTIPADCVVIRLAPGRAAVKRRQGGRTMTARLCAALGVVIALMTLAGAAPAPPTHRPIEGILRSGGLRQAFPVTTSAFAHPQDVTPPFALQVIAANTLTHTTAFASSGVYTVQNPAIQLDFSVKPDMAQYLGGLN